jgi:hypothetical protein
MSPKLRIVANSFARSGGPLALAIEATSRKYSKAPWVSHRVTVTAPTVLNGRGRRAGCP